MNNRECSTLTKNTRMTLGNVAVSGIVLVSLVTWAVRGEGRIDANEQRVNHAHERINRLEDRILTELQEIRGHVRELTDR